MEKENNRGGKSAGVAFIGELVEGVRYSFGEPWQLTSESLSAVVPVLRRFDRDRKYLLIQEIPNDKVSITDSGQINKLNVMLKGSKEPVFVRAGTIFKGQGTQSRTSGTGMVLEPEKENLVDVFCVHASHGISVLSGFSTMMDVVPRKIEDVLSSQSRSQGRVWQASAVRGSRSNVTHCPQCGSPELLQTYEAELVCVQCGYVIAPDLRSDLTRERTERIRSRAPYIAAFGTGFPELHNPVTRDNLVANLDEMRKFNERVEEMLSKVPADLRNQVGVVIIDSRGVLGLEIFDHPDSWRAFSRSIVRNYADILAKERADEGLFSLRTERVPESIKKFLANAEKLSETTLFKNRISETKMLSGELTGEYTIMGSDMIHLVLKRKTTA